MEVHIIHDLIEQNGKSIKENNLLKSHNVPINSLVEIQGFESMEGSRMFVVGHCRDCDGTPLYILCADKEDKEFELFGLKINKKHSGFPERCLKRIS